MSVISVIKYWDEIKEILKENNLLRWETNDALISVLNELSFEDIFKLYEKYLDKNKWLKAILLFEILIGLATGNKWTKEQIDKIISEKIRLYNKLNDWIYCSNENERKRIEQISWLIVVRLTTLNN